jgi:hypothetical protein
MYDSEVYYEDSDIPKSGHVVATDEGTFMFWFSQNTYEWYGKFAYTDDANKFKDK